VEVALDVVRRHLQDKTSSLSICGHKRLALFGFARSEFPKARKFPVLGKKSISSQCYYKIAEQAQLAL
jgi:hypothetical protein